MKTILVFLLICAFNLTSYSQNKEVIKKVIDGKELSIEIYLSHESRKIPQVDRQVQNSLASILINVDSTSILCGVLKVNKLKKMDSPFYVTEDIIIPEGTNLIIEPGTKIIFTGNYFIKGSSNSSITAVGKPDSLIEFLSANENIYWRGIRLGVGMDPNTIFPDVNFKYCKFSGAWKDVDWNDDSNFFGSAIYIGFPMGSTSIENCHFENNVCSGSENGGVIYCDSPYTLFLLNNTFINNVGGCIAKPSFQTISLNNKFLANTGIALSFQNGKNYVIKNIVSNNDFTGCATGVGVVFLQNAQAIIQNSIVSYNIPEGISLTNSSYAEVINSIVFNNQAVNQIIQGNNSSTYAYYSVIQGGFDGLSIYDTDPLFINPPAGSGNSFFSEDINFDLQNNSPCVNAGDPNFIYKDEDLTRNDIGIYGGTYLFLSSKELDFQINPLIKSSGVYSVQPKEITLFNYNNSSFVIDSAATFNNFFDVTNTYFLLIVFPNDRNSLSIVPVISTSGSYSDSLVLFHNSDSILIPLKIQLIGGTAVSGFITGPLTFDKSPYIVEGNIIFDSAMVIEPGVELLLKEGVQIINNNFLTAKGNPSQPIIFKSLQTNKSWEGIYSLDDSQIELDHCIVKDAIYGGLTVNKASHVIISNSTFENILGFGLKLFGTDQALIFNNIFYNNYEGIDLFETNDVNIYNNLFFKTGRGLVYYYNMANPVKPKGNVFNNIFWDLITPVWDGSEFVNFSYNCFSSTILESNNILEGNIYENPLFIDASSLDFHLNENSPCIDAGTKYYEGIDFPLEDKNGLPRQSGSSIDIGPFEFQHASSIDFENSLPANFSLSQNYPNPFNPVTQIEYSIAENSHVDLFVFDILGQKVSTLILNQIHNVGNYKISFNAENLPSGLYLYQIRTEKFQQIKKMLLVK